VAGDPVDDLEVQGSAAGGQLALGDLVGGEQGTLAADQTDQGGAGAFADAQGGEFGVEARPFPPPPFAGARRRPAVEGGEKEDEAAEEAEGEGPCLGRAERPRGLGYFFLAASARACCRAACARRLATS
jgi:hypothetical protein